MLDPDENFIDSFIDEVYFDDLVVEKDFADVKYFAIIILKYLIPFRLRR